MATNKKEIYAKYDIEYKAGKILSPIGYVPELLKEGNSKTGKAVYTWSILPGTEKVEIEYNGIKFESIGTCVCNCKGCYAMTGFYKMKNVITALAVNTYLINNYPDFVKNAIMAQLETIGLGEIRIHAAGDFNTTDPEKYAAMWYDIAKKNPTQ